MSDFNVDMRDVRFNLFDFLEVGSLAKAKHFEDFDAEVLGDILNMAYEQAKEIIAPLSAQGDRVGVKLVDGRVKTPDGWPAAYKKYMEAGWNGLVVPQEHGGQGVPTAVGAAVQEMMVAANVSFCFTPGLTTGALGLVAEFGTKEQKAIYLDKMLSGEWSGTMCLTEPNAGSAVPDLRSMAYPIADRDGFYKIKGQKIFISSGDHDLTDNVVHLFLARVEGDPPGHAGISLFIVPRCRPDARGEAGEFNDVHTVALEEKMGIHASPTCALSFGDNDDCVGWLIGGRGEGLKCMFKMMNEARIAVGMQGVGLGNLAFQRAVRYAKERVQGTRIQDMRKENAERVAIIEHPDVRRNLMMMKALGEGGRALSYYAAYCQDKLAIAEDDAERKRWGHQLEILTPIVKAWCSDEGFKGTELGVQVLGGYGYCREYGLEQLLRDSKIASIYEGTNGIQALDLIGRKIARGGGVMLMSMLNEVNKTLNGPDKDGAFKDEIAAVAKARDALVSTAMDFGQRMMKGDVGYAALHATPFLQMFGDTLVAWLLLRQAMVAKRLYDTRLQQAQVEDDDAQLGRVLHEDDEARYLHGKMATAQFFVHQVLPRVFARKASMSSGDRSALDVVL